MDFIVGLFTRKRLRDRSEKPTALIILGMDDEGEDLQRIARPNGALCCFHGDEIQRPMGKAIIKNK